MGLLSKTRSGRLVSQPQGFQAFIPAPLPPEPPVAIDRDMQLLLSQADQAIGRLDGLVSVIPNTDVFVDMYVRREAVLSSQIEGTQSTLQDLLREELEPAKGRPRSDVDEIVNYVKAMNYGLERLDTLPLSLRLIKEIHGELLSGDRGAHATPGEFRRTQNWIGPPGATLARATFVPPPVSELMAALDNLEKFLYLEGKQPSLIDIGLIHAQFETIHPFLDGNGRVGRLLITFLLVHRGILRRPLLYLSHFFKLHQAEYYARLHAVHTDGDWEGWIRFFLRGVAENAREATNTAQLVFELRERHQTLVMNEVGANGFRLLNELFQRPLINVGQIASALDLAFDTASNLVARFEKLDILVEITGRRRGRMYRYEAYVNLFEDVNL